MDEKELQEFDIEDIIREFGSASQKQMPEEMQEEKSEEAVEEKYEEAAEEKSEEVPEEQPEDEIQQTRRIDPVKIVLPEDMDETRRIDSPEEQLPEDMDQTRRIESVKEEQPESELSGDTVRLEGLREKISEQIQHQNDEDSAEDKIWKAGDTVHTEPFSERWEPEYEQPMGEYIPPQPIQFRPTSRLQELKHKLIAGPEKRYYELSEKGVGGLQAMIFLSLLVVLICAASSVMYAMGMVQESRMRLMVFGQILAMLVSALLGSYQLVEGVTDLGKKKFTLNTMLVVTFIVCCVDGILCLRQLRVPCCAAFSLEITMSLWGAYQRKNCEMSQMDTMRKAVRLDGVAACPDYLDGKTGLLRKQGQVEDFMDSYATQGKSEKNLNTYALIAMIISIDIGIAAGLLKGLSVGIQVAAVSLLAAMPATAFICQIRPAWILERRLHRLGTVLCGWRGIEGLSDKVVFPVNYYDLYPANSVRLNGVKYFGNREPDQVVAYAAAVIEADACGLTGLFRQILDVHNGRHYDAYDLARYENGGISALVENETVLLGSPSFMKEMGVDIPENARVSDAVYVAIGKELSGLFALSYENTQSALAGLATLTSYRGLQCVLTSNDFVLTQGFMRNKFDIKQKNFLMPEFEVRDTLQQKEAPADTQTLLMTTSIGLASLAYGVTGARALRSACRLGTVLHIVGGAIGLGIMILLVLLGALELQTPVNMFLYQLVWTIPALLITEWTRSI